MITTPANVSEGLAGIIAKYEAGNNHDSRHFDPECRTCLILNDLRALITLSPPLPSLEVERLRKALEPFARVRIWPDSSDGASVRVIRPIGPEERQERLDRGRPDLGEGAQEIISFDGLTLGDFRRASAALSALPPLEDRL